MKLSDLVSDYHTPTEAARLIHEHPPLIVCGVTAAGKDTIVRYLTQSDDYAQVVSHTTRTPRSHNDGNEVNGLDYWFVDERTAITMLSEQSFIEAKLVHGDTLYGTSVKAYERVVNSGRQPILEIDIQGVLELMSVVSDLEAIFLAPPDFETWQARLNGRGHMSQQERIKRLVSAVTEFEMFASNPRFTPLINNEVIDTAAMIHDGSYKNDESTKRARLVIEQLLDQTRQTLRST